MCTKKCRPDNETQVYLQMYHVFFHDETWIPILGPHHTKYFDVKMDTMPYFTFQKSKKKHDLPTYLPGFRSEKTLLESEARRPSSFSP